MSRPKDTTGPTQTPATPLEGPHSAVSTQFIETLRSLHVNQRVLEAAEKAVREYEASRNGDPAPSRT